MKEPNTQALRAAIPEAEDLRPWGHAPGSYVFKCQDCPADLDIYEKMGRLGDKRSWRCEEHAREAKSAALEIANASTLTTDRHAEGRLAGQTERAQETLKRHAQNWTWDEVVAAMLRFAAAESNAAGLEEAAKLADMQQASCQYEADSRLPGVDQATWLRAAEEFGMFAAQLRRAIAKAGQS